MEPTAGRETIQTWKAMKKLLLAKMLVGSIGSILMIAGRPATEPTMAHDVYVVNTFYDSVLIAYGFYSVDRPDVITTRGWEVVGPADTVKILEHYRCPSFYWRAVCKDGSTIGGPVGLYTGALEDSVWLKFEADNDRSGCRTRFYREVPLRDSVHYEVLELPSAFKDSCAAGCGERWTPVDTVWGCWNEVDMLVGFWRYRCDTMAVEATYSEGVLIGDVHIKTSTGFEEWSTYVNDKRQGKAAFTYWGGVRLDYNYDNGLLHGRQVISPTKGCWYSVTYDHGLVVGEPSDYTGKNCAERLREEAPEPPNMLEQKR